MKTVLVTGSSRGIGKAIAQVFAKNGFQVALNGYHHLDVLEETKEELSHYCPKCVSYRADCSNYDACSKMVDFVETQLGPIDILVNNAGVSYVGLFSEMQPEKWQELMAVNLFGAMNLSHAVIPSMVARKAGIILNISSVWGEKGASCEAAYSASKGGLNAFTMALAKELGPSGIRVNAIACGAVETEMNAWLDLEEKQALTDEISLGRFGSVEEIAQGAFSVCNLTYLTGQIITMDGGLLS